MVRKLRLIGDEMFMHFPNSTPENSNSDQGQPQFSKPKLLPPQSNMVISREKKRQ